MRARVTIHSPSGSTDHFLEEGRSARVGSRGDVENPVHDDPLLSGKHFANASRGAEPSFRNAEPHLAPARQRLLEILTAAPGPLYAVLDAARDLRALDWLKEEQAEYESLYDGDSAVDLEMFAPYLVRLAPGAPLLTRLAATAWGEAWGTFALCPLPLAEVRKHFRRFLMVEFEGKPVYFRFYDPRVLRVYLPTCTAAELRELFGPLKAFLLEGESPDVLLRFSLGEKGLVREEVSLEGADSLPRPEQRGDVARRGVPAHEPENPVGPRQGDPQGS